MVDLLWVIFWTLLSLDMKQIHVETVYSKREQEWNCKLMATFAVQMAGFCLHKALMIGVANNTRRHKIISRLFAVFMGILCGMQMRLFFIGFNLNSDQPNPGTPNGQPENEYVHSTKIVFVIYGVIVLVFIVVVLLIICCAFYSIFSSEIRRRDARNR